MKVGLLYPRTGAAGVWAPSLDAAALLAASEINESAAEPLAFAVQDCGATVETALDAVETLIRVDGVDAILGANPSNMRDPISDRIAGRAAYIYTSQYEGAACGRSTMAIGSADQDLIGPALNWLKEVKRAERFCFIGDDYVWPRTACELSARAVRAQGGRWLGGAFLDAGPQDYADLLKRLARSGVQVVILGLVGQNAILFNRAFAAAGLDEKILRFGLLVDETVICGVGAEASNNLFTAAHYFAALRSRANDDFLERYHDAFGEFAPPVSASSAGYYQGVRFVAELSRALEAEAGRDLARHLDRTPSRRIARGLLRHGPIGGKSAVRLAEAEGVTLRVVAEFAS